MTLSMHPCPGTKHPNREAFAALTTASTLSVVMSPLQTARDEAPGSSVATDSASASTIPFFRVSSRR